MEATIFGRARQVPFKNYWAYYPNPLPEHLDLLPETVERLAEAEAALGQLAGVGRLLPSPHLLIRPYLLRESIFSTRIEGTRTSLVEVLEAETNGQHHDPDIEEVLNYIKATEQGLSRLTELPFSIRLLKELHATILRGVRGRDRQPGEVRRTQNWIGSPGATLETATFVPPPPEEVGPLLSNWERFLHQNRTIPLLIQNGLLHYQFETIHPFLDGNGRLGRLAIILHLVHRGRLPQPLLYLSAYFEAHRSEYYNGLQAVRERGDIDAWLCFYLNGIETQANDAVIRINRLLDLRVKYQNFVMRSTRSQAGALLDHLFALPVITASRVVTLLNVTRPTALRMLDQLTKLEILTEISPGPRRERRFIAEELINALE